VPDARLCTRVVGTQLERVIDELARAVEEVREQLARDAQRRGCREAGALGRRPLVGQLRGDDRPRLVGVAPLEVEAGQAGAHARFDERPDAHAALAEDDAEVGDVPPQPQPVPARRDGVAADQHGRVDARGLVVGVGAEPGDAVDQSRAQAAQHGRERAGGRPVALHGDPQPARVARVGCAWCRGGGRRLGQQGRPYGVEQGGGEALADAGGLGDHGQRRLGSADGEGREQPLDRRRRALEDAHDGVDAELHDVRCAPDDGHGGVEAEDHRPSMPRAASARGILSTAGRPLPQGRPLWHRDIDATRRSGRCRPRRNALRPRRGLGCPSSPGAPSSPTSSG